MTAVKRKYMIRRNSLYILDFNREYKINNLSLVTHFKEKLPDLSNDWVHEEDVIKSEISTKILNKIIAYLVNKNKNENKISAKLYFYSSDSELNFNDYSESKVSHVESSNILYIKDNDFIHNKEFIINLNSTSRIFIVRVGNTFVVTSSLESFEKYKYKNIGKNKTENMNVSLGFSIALNKALELLNKNPDNLSYYVVNPAKTPAVSSYLHLATPKEIVKLQDNSPLSFIKNEDEDITFSELNKFQSTNEIFKTSFTNLNQVPYNITQITANYQNQKITLYGVGDTLNESYKNAFINMLPHFMNENFNNNVNRLRWGAVQGPEELEVTKGLLLLNYLTSKEEQEVGCFTLDLKNACELSENTFFTRKYIFEAMKPHLNQVKFFIQQINNTDIYHITVTDGKEKVWEDGGNKLSVLIEKTLTILFALKVQNDVVYPSYYQSSTFDQQYIKKYEWNTDSIVESFNVNELLHYYNVQISVNEWIYRKVLRKTRIKLLKLSIEEV